MRKQKGFTLIELMAVILILTVLMSIILPALWRTVNLAQETDAREDLHQLSVAWKAYLNRYRRFPTDLNGQLVLIEEMDTNAISILLGNDYNLDNLHFMEFSKTHEEHGFLDPWGDKALNKGDMSWQNRRYQVALDIGIGAYDSTAAYDGKVTPPHFDKPLFLSVATWSKGADGINNTSDDVVSK